MQDNIVGKLVEEEVDFTRNLIQNFEGFIINKGVDIIQAVLILVVGYMICRWLRSGIQRVLSRRSADPSANSFVSEIIFFFSLAIILIMALEAVGVAPSTLVAAFGGLGLAIGLGLKDNVGNVASGIFILIFRPFKVGDYIQIGTNQGTVVDIRIMYTEMSTLGNQMISIPNSQLTNSIIKNYSSFITRNIEFVFDVGYETDLVKCIEILKKVFREDEYVLNGADLPIYVSSMAESSIRIYVRAQVERIKYYDAQNQLYIKVKNAFDDAGISIPFPQLVIHQGDKES